MQKNNIRWRTALGYDMGKRIGKAMLYIICHLCCVCMEDLEVDTTWNTGHLDTIDKSQSKPDTPMFHWLSKRQIKTMSLLPRDCEISISISSATSSVPFPARVLLCRIICTPHRPCYALSSLTNDPRDFKGEYVHLPELTNLNITKPADLPQ